MTGRITDLRVRVSRSAPAGAHAAATFVLMAGLAGCGERVAEDQPETIEIAIEQAAKPYNWLTLDGEPPIVIAHRGASGELPEHTIEAYELALQQGADAIEPDLVLTRDGVLVARHDRHLSTTTNVADLPAFADRRRADPDPAGEGREDWWIEDFSLDELKSLKARQPRDGRSKEHDDQFEIPTFGEVLVLASVHAEEDGRPIAVYPETKSPGYFASIGLDFLNPLVIALEGYDAGLVYLQSFEPEILRRLRNDTSASLVLLTDDPAAITPAALEDAASFVDGVGVAKGLVVDGAGCDTGLVAAAHARGLFVHAWTYRDDEATPFAAGGEAGCGGTGGTAAAAELDAAYRAGVDGVFADFPASAIAVREAIGE